MGPFEIILIVITITIETAVLSYIFKWDLAKALGITALMNIVSFLGASIALLYALSKFPTHWFHLWYMANHYIQVMTPFVLIWWGARIIIEILLCRLWAKNFPLSRVVITILLVNIVTLTPGTIRTLKASKPHVTPESFVLVEKADWIAPVQEKLIYYSLDSHALIEAAPGTDVTRDLAADASYHGYRIVLDGSAVLSPGVSNTLLLTMNDISNTFSYHLPQPITKPALCDISPDQKYVAVAVSNMCHIFNRENGMVTNSITCPVVSNNSWLSWTADGTAVCINDADNYAIIPWPNTSVDITYTNVLPKLAVSWATKDYYAPPGEAHYTSSQANITVNPTNGITIKSASDYSTLRISTAQRYFGIGFLSDQETFLFAIGHEILALNLRTREIGNLVDGVLPLLTKPRYRVPPFMDAKPPVQSEPPGNFYAPDVEE